MGEYANYALAAAFRHGSPHHAYVPKAGPRDKCPLCPREIGGGFMGMADHMKSKHDMSGPVARRYVADLRSQPVSTQGAGSAEQASPSDQ